MIVSQIRILSLLVKLQAGKCKLPRITCRDGLEDKKLERLLSDVYRDTTSYPGLVLILQRKGLSAKY